MPAGRPTKYRPEMCEKVIECGREGKSLAQMAAALDVDRDTIKEWRKEKPEFSAAIKKARYLAQAWWDDLGQKGASGMVDGFNATSFVWQTKNRFPEDYRDKHELDHNVTGEIIVEIGGSVDED